MAGSDKNGNQTRRDSSHRRAALEYQSFAAEFTVDSTVDHVDLTPGDGVCATATGQCALRAATQETTALSGADTINVPSGTYALGVRPWIHLGKNFGRSVENLPLYRQMRFTGVLPKKKPRLSGVRSEEVIIHRAICRAGFLLQ